MSIGLRVGGWCGFHSICIVSEQQWRPGGSFADGNFTASSTADRYVLVSLFPEKSSYGLDVPVALDCLQILPRNPER
jgi:hypothetical protein